MERTVAIQSAPASSSRERFGQFYARHRQTMEAWMILTPILIYYIIFYVAPVIANLFVSFISWNGLKEAKWVGFANFEKFIKTPLYMQVLANTLFFAITILLISAALGFLVAMALNEKVKGLGIYRTMWYVPTLTSAAVTAQVANVFIAPGTGVISAVMKSLGQPELIWQINTDFARIFIIIFAIWRGVGGSMLLYLAGLQGISTEVLDAAKVDGASGWKLTRYIILPLLRPMTVFVLVTGLIGGFQIFEPILLITNGQPGNTTNVMMTQIYKDAFQNQDFGMAATQATIMLLILLWASFMNLRLMGQSSGDEG
jgi:multiple sugar transport system permease protein